MPKDSHGHDLGELRDEVERVTLFDELVEALRWQKLRTMGWIHDHGKARRENTQQQLAVDGVAWVGCSWMSVPGGNSMPAVEELEQVAAAS